MSMVMKQTKHPYITRNKKIRGGVPVTLFLSRQRGQGQGSHLDL